MNEQDQNFDALRKLLSLKQHEVPPPGFFDGFSGSVVSRIRRGDSGRTDTLGSRIHSEAPWLLRLIQGFQARPAYAGVFASALCLLLVAGIVYTDNPGATPEDLMPPQTAESGASLATAAMTSPAFTEQSGAPAEASSVSSTNPVLNLDPGSSPFGAQSSLFKPVGYPQ